MGKIRYFMWTDWPDIDVINLLGGDNQSQSEEPHCGYVYLEWGEDWDDCVMCCQYIYDICWASCSEDPYAVRMPASQ